MMEKGDFRLRALIGVRHIRVSEFRGVAEICRVASVLFEIPDTGDPERMAADVYALGRTRRRVLVNRNRSKIPARADAKSSESVSHRGGDSARPGDLFS